MPPAVHAAIGRWFLNKFGVDYRGTSLFCTGDRAVAAGYKNETNSIIVVSPIEPFSICYSPRCKDLYGHYLFHWSRSHDPSSLAEAELDGLGFIHYFNEGLAEAAASGQETMIYAEKFQYHVVGVR